MPLKLRRLFLCVCERVQMSLVYRNEEKCKYMYFIATFIINTIVCFDQFHFLVFSDQNISNN